MVGCHALEALAGYRLGRHKPERPEIPAADQRPASSRLPRIKAGKAQREHMFSAVHPITDVAKILQHVRLVPLAEAMLMAEFVCIRRALSVARKRLETGPA